MLDHVILLGAYGGFNMGDELILREVLSVIGDLGLGVDVTVLSGNPKSTRSMHDVHSAPRAAAHQLLAELTKQDRRVGLVIAGGQQIQEARFGNPFRGLLIEAYRAAKHANKFGAPVIVWNVGVSPLRWPQSKPILRDLASRTEFFVVRDQLSHRLVDSYLSKSHAAELGADPAFRLTYRESFLDQQLHRASAGGSNYLLITPAVVRGFPLGRAISLVRSAAAAASSLGMQPVVMLMDYRNKYDGSLLPVLYGANEEVIVVKAIDVGLNSVVELIRGASAVVTARLHPLIVAMTQVVPAIAIPWSSKLREASRSIHVYTLDPRRSPRDWVKDICERIESIDATKYALTLTPYVQLMRKRLATSTELLSGFIEEAYSDDHKGAPHCRDS